MTTGLQKVTPFDRRLRAPRSAVLRPVALRHWFSGRMARLRGAVHGIGSAAGPSARDVHDAAVMRGVFPPRI
jgi:hypothetical protein